MSFYSNRPKTSLASRDTGKESQNPSVTKIYSVGFNHDAVLSRKKRSQNHSGDISCKRIKSDRKNLVAKTQETVKQLEITQSICCFYICLSIYRKLTS